MAGKLIFDDETTPQAAPAGRKLVFDDQQPAPSDISKGESVARGALQGVSAGFSDELAGAAETPMKKIADWMAGNKGKDAKGYYQEFRDEERGKNAAAEAANPKSYGAGEIGGMTATSFLPGMGEVNAAKMAALGGLQGLGHSQADLTRGNYKGAALDTGKGAAAGYVGGLAGEGISKGLTNATNPEWWQGIANTRASKALGFTKRFLNRPDKLAAAKSAGQTMLEEGVVTPLATTEDMAARVTALQQKSGQGIGDFLENTGGQGLDPNKAIAAIEELRPVERGGHYTPIHKSLDKAIETIQAHGNSPIPWKEANEIKTLLQDVSKFNSNTDALTTMTNRRAAGAYRGTLDDMLESASKEQPPFLKTVRATGQPGEISPPGGVWEGIEPDTTGRRFDQFLRDKKVFGAAARAEDALNNRLSSEIGNKTIGLTDTIAAAGELAAGNPMAAGGLLGAKHVVERFGNQTAAVGAHKVAQGAQWLSGHLPEALQSTPQLFGKYAPLLQQAATGGAQALAVRHFVLMNSDPEYRQTIRNVEDSGQ